MSTLFIQITPETTEHTIASNLTKMQYRVWLFLYHLDPFGDRPVLIPTPVELAQRLNMSVRSIYRALQKLSELGLFTIASNYQRSITNGIKNQPLGTKKLRSRNFKACAKNGNVDDKIGTTVTKQAHKCQNWQNQPPQPNQNNGFTPPQTNTDNIQTLSDIEENENINSTANSQELVDYWFEDDVCNSSSIAVKDPGGESIAAEVEILNENDNSNIAAELVDNDRLKDNNTATNSIALSNWLPSGPWSIDSKLDPNFRDWLAKDWISRYGGTIHQRRADVLSHFQNKPGMLPVRWEQYHSEYVDRFTNAQTRMTNGISIAPDEQHQLLQHTAAVTNPLPAELNPVAAKSGRGRTMVRPYKSQESGVKVTKLVQQSKTVDTSNKSKTANLAEKNKSETKKLLPVRYPVRLAPTRGRTVPDSRLLTPRESVIDFSALDRDEEIPENPDAYKLLRPSNINPKAGLELLKSAFTMKKPLAKPKTELKENPLAKLNDWLKDDILYPEAVRRAKKLGYSIEYNENGRAIAIYELDF